MMRALIPVAVLMFAATLSAAAQSPAIPGLIAKRETAVLSYEDKLAAYDAEQAALGHGGLVLGYNWKGPKGAYGTIIVGGLIPQTGRFGICRRFTHIVHHKDDGGRNPTFSGTVCRGEGGQWSPQ